MISGFPEIDRESARTLGAKIASNRDELLPGLTDADIIATFQDYLGQWLLDRLGAVVRRQFPGERPNRADYRPVAPICLEERASEVFTPGTADPYMLFEHRLRPGWAERVPAVVHLDGTARLQTIGENDHSAAARVLAAYAEISGVPVICNTSANLGGRGFFPDLASAARWGGTRYIWSEGVLYTNPNTR
nr:carbamoyltransferase C-terminal domain-containing protein [Nocardia sienata]